MAKDSKKTSLDKAEASVQEEKSTKKAKQSDAKPKKNTGKKDEGKKRNVFQAIGKWFHDLKVEFGNVTWPSMNTVTINTGVVLTVIVAGSVIVGLLDTGLLKLLQFLVGLSQ